MLLLRSEESWLRGAYPQEEQTVHHGAEHVLEALQEADKDLDGQVQVLRGGVFAQVELELR